MWILVTENPAGTVYSTEHSGHSLGMWCHAVWLRFEETAPSIFTPTSTLETKAASFYQTTPHHIQKTITLIHNHYFSLFQTLVILQFHSSLVAPTVIQQLSAISVLSSHLTFVLTTHLSYWVNFLGPPYPIHNLPSPSLQYLSNQIRGGKLNQILDETDILKFEVGCMLL